MKLAYIFTGLFMLASTPAVQAMEEDDNTAQYSYILGYQIGQRLGQEGIELDVAGFTAALRDVAGSRPSRYSDSETKQIASAWRKSQHEKRMAAADENAKAGEAFLQKNGKADGVITTDSGLQYRATSTGNGKQPDNRGTVVVHYRGSLINGEEFDSSYARGKPTTLVLDHVIKGWQEILPMMHEGDKWQVYIPPQLAYGMQGSPPAIGPNETLIFDIELVEVR